MTTGWWFTGDIDGHHPFTGTLDELRVYNRALNEAEIDSLCSQATGCGSATPLSVSASVNSACTGELGAVKFSVSGGVPPYSYLWSTGDTVDTVSDLPAGSYSVSVYDASGCFFTDTIFNVTSSDGLLLVFSSTPENCGASNATATVHAIGGSGTLSYQWSAAGGTDSVLTGLSSGTYIVTVTDSEGCSGSAGVKIDSCITSVNILAGEYSVKIFPNPFNESTTIEVSGLNASFSFTLYDVPAG